MNRILSAVLMLGFAAGGSPADQEQPQAKRARLAYISNIMSHTVSVIELDSLSWLRDLHLGQYPIFSSLHPHDPTKLIVALHNYERRDGEGAVVLVDLRTEKVIKRVSFPGASMPSGFVYDGKRDRIYIADENLHRVFIMDGTTLDIISDLPAGLIPVHVGLCPDAKWLVVTNRKSADLYVYDLDNILRSAKDGIYTIHLGPSPGCAWDSDESGRFSHPIDVGFCNEPDVCLVTDYNTMELLFVDIAKQEIIDRVAFDRRPFDIAFDHRKTLAFVCHVDGDAISVVDLGKRKIQATIQGLASNPIHCELDEENSRLVAACWGGGQTGGVYIIDLKSYRILKYLPLEGAKASIGITVANAP
ncbi:MAG: hypothetical protein AB1714_05725 [Acidobacteriota bacterium]